MENQGNNKPTVFAELELEGQRVECPICRVTLDVHLGLLILPEFICHACESGLTLMDISRTTDCPCCHFSRPVPSSNAFTVCRRCEARVIHPKEARTAKCPLCKIITICAARRMSRLVVPQADPHQNVPPQFCWSDSPQVNLANPREQAILFADVNRSLNPQVNQPRIIHPKVIRVSEAGQRLYPQANQAASRTQVNHVAQVNQTVHYPQVINQVATRNQFSVAQVNQTFRPQVGPRNRGNMVGPRNRGNMVGPRNRGNMVAHVNQTVHHQVNQDVPHFVTPPQVNWNSPHAVNPVAPFQVNWDAPRAVNHVAPPQDHWSAPYVDLVSPLRDGNRVVPPVVNEVVTPRANHVAPLGLNMVATPGANHVSPLALNVVATPGAKNVVPPSVNMVATSGANQVATPRADQVAPLALNVVATPGANQVAPFVVKGFATPGTHQVAPIHINLESDLTASSSGHRRPNGVRKSNYDDEAMKKIVEQIRKTAYKNRRDNAAAEEQEKSEGSKSKKSRQ